MRSFDCGANTSSGFWDLNSAGKTREACDVAAYYSFGACVWRWRRVLRVFAMGNWRWVGNFGDGVGDRSSGVPAWRVALELTDR